MYLTEQKKLVERLRSILKTRFDVDQATLAIEQPPEIRFGEYALPVAFELAKRLKKAPRKIAEELILHLSSELGPADGFAGFEVAGAGYINVRLDRSSAAQVIAANEKEAANAAPVHALVATTAPAADTADSSRAPFPPPAIPTCSNKSYFRAAATAAGGRPASGTSSRRPST